ncbi:MAG: anaerobic carbon-monoxide dehydrogenase catalytic subunit [Dethiobacter sp.]|jgi:carbon-monoxide dehydrogenase catalytic subunit|nr:MAG: anaerobic carbon-monoxide dehydrogenase catalytic subunit [Dethiobacter sp.]
MAEKKKDRNLSIDPAALEVLAKTEGGNIETAYQRYLNMQPQCQYGNTGICCTICIQGPCRITKKASKGICGAAPYTIVARNLLRHVLGGTSCHSDHGLHITMVMKEIVDGHGGDYSITDSAKLKRVADRLGIPIEGRTDQEILKDVINLAMEEFSRLDKDKYSVWLEKTVVPERVEKAMDCNIMPNSIHKTVTESMAQTHMGMDADPVNLVFQSLKTALCDYIGMHIATDLSDILFGTPTPVVSEANMGVLGEKTVNIALHGHNPILSEMVVRAAREMQDEAKAAGAEGIKCMGICCTGNEVLMRQGVPVLTNFLSQELAIMTGAVDAMVVDVQCIMPGVQTVAECFHTKIITTIPNVKIPSSYYVDFDETRALEKAREIVSIAIEAFKERDPSKVSIPQVKNKVVAGFSLEALTEVLAAVNPDNPIKVITDAVDSGELAGICLFAGCNNLKVTHDENHTVIARELAKNNVLLVATGCAAGSFAKLGLLNSDAVEKYAGEGLKAFLNRLNEANKDKLQEKMPLIFHMGSCVDNTRAYDLVTALAKQWQMDTPKVPFAASAPEAMSEKAISIGSWVVTLGMPVHVGVIPPIPGSALIDGIALQIAQDVYGGYFMWEEDPMEASKKLLAALQERVWKLKVHRMAKERYETEAISKTW